MAGSFTGYAGIAGGFGAQPQPQPVQPQYNPYGYYGIPGAVAPAGSNQYYNPGTETIQGDTVQTGTFKGHGTGAKIQGGFTASGNIQ